MKLAVSSCFAFFSVPVFLTSVIGENENAKIGDRRATSDDAISPYNNISDKMQK